ncbi:MAG: alpha-ketoglutarate-dependent dioxygenase AlkB [Acetobacteraceae bacterium]|nr:alpha-ketoglutarate-dependent dioxygenase AlkB [Acetobacteraceae bacterium]
MTTGQLSLFEKPASSLPPGFLYAQDVIAPEEEAALLEAFATFPFANFEFRGFLGQRRTVSFGWRYDFGASALRPAEPIPASLVPLRDRAAAFAGLEPAELAHVMVTEYTPGAAIGWHRDRAEFGEVIGVSLASACTFRFRRKQETGWERRSLVLQPRSAYVLRGPSRTQWEHSIPGVDALRYSVTFRTLR